MVNFCPDGGKMKKKFDSKSCLNIFDEMFRSLDETLEKGGRRKKSFDFF